MCMEHSLVREWKRLLTSFWCTGRYGQGAVPHGKGTTRLSRAPFCTGPLRISIRMRTSTCNNIFMNFCFTLSLYRFLPIHYDRSSHQKFPEYTLANCSACSDRSYSNTLRTQLDSRTPKPATCIQGVHIFDKHSRQCLTICGKYCHLHIYQDSES